ncbi:MAG: sigma-70 family RNA polymerase sigma factor [Oscillospiraceae bacterium]|nr:sigma-70 family RNA polymerase sigma factor [Oscillospiraceae bacterium]
MPLEKLQQDHLIEIINNLPLDERVAVYFYYIEKLDVSQIAEQLAISPDEVGERLTHARAKIKEDTDKDNNPLGAIFVTGGLIAFIPILKTAMKTSDFPSEVMNVIAKMNISASAATSAGTAVTTAALPIKTIAAVIGGVVVTGGLVAGVLIADPFDWRNTTPAYVDSDETRRTTTATTENEHSEYDTPESGNSTRPAQVGEIIQFGDYSWLVLETQPDRMLIISDNILSSFHSYNFQNEPVGFLESDLHTYLTTVFYSSFDQADRARIISDIRILHLDEIDMYFSSDVGRIAYYSGQPYWWWLQSPVQSIGDGMFYVPCVLEDGSILEIGNAVTTYGGVRPVMWISTAEPTTLPVNDSLRTRFMHTLDLAEQYDGLALYSDGTHFYGFSPPGLGEISYLHYTGGTESDVYTQLQNNPQQSFLLFETSDNMVTIGTVTADEMHWWLFRSDEYGYLYLQTTNDHGSVTPGQPYYPNLVYQGTIVNGTLIPVEDSPAAGITETSGGFFDYLQGFMDSAAEQGGYALYYSLNYYYHFGFYSNGDIIFGTHGLPLLDTDWDTQGTIQGYDGNTLLIHLNSINTELIFSDDGREFYYGGVEDGTFYYTGSVVDGELILYSSN